MQLVDPKLLCPICEVVKTTRARHCKVCNRCIDRNDHHCPWINNCVGAGNHKRFMAFITLLMITLIYNFYFGISTFLWILKQKSLAKHFLLYSVFSDGIQLDRTLLLAASLTITISTGMFILFAG